MPKGGTGRQSFEEWWESGEREGGIGPEKGGAETAEGVWTQIE
jgi:hypothetical protein